MPVPSPTGLYDPRFEHDACGVGFLADLAGGQESSVLPLALRALARMNHRGAIDADGRTGDGAGVITQIPRAVLRADLPPGHLGVGMLFLPLDRAGAARARTVAGEALAAEGLAARGWREVPVQEEVLGKRAWQCRPGIEQVLVERPPGDSADEFERRLYRARQGMEARAADGRLDGFYVASLSHRTIVYKAMVQAVDLSEFYLDLRHPDYATAFAVFHQRFSTNTLPSWAMTQPFRLLAHNGEINTIEGNRAWMRAREATLAAPRLGLFPGARGPVLTEGGSDSASLDEALGLLTAAGRDVLQGMSLLVPPAWEGDPEMAAEVRDFFDYQSCLMEPWDGPALAVFTDGWTVGAALDRNGLRPARYLVTVDGLVLLASEVGVLAVEEERVLRRGRLGPGDVLAVDLRAGRLLDRETVHRSLAGRRPYGRWLRAHRVELDRVRAAAPAAEDGGGEAPTLESLRAFGYSREELQLVLGPMHRQGLEPLGSMGDDTPLAVLSKRPRLLYSYFKQRFAQVTNPPIDPLRESMVMSLGVHLGAQGNLLAEAPEAAAQVHLPGPFLRDRDLAALRAWGGTGGQARTLSLLFPAGGGELAFRRALDELLREAVRAVEAGATMLVLSDRGVDAAHAALPMLLTVATVHQHLVGAGLRLRASLIAETGEARDDHQMACLLGYGASAVNPYLALAVVRQESGSSERYLRALDKGLLKILSKMGISTLRSYHGAQLFEAIGIAPEVVRRCFTGTPSAVGGVGLSTIASETLARHASAFAEGAAGLEEGSLHRYRRNGEAHAFEPPVIRALHAAIRTGGGLAYREYAELVRSRDPIVLRDLLELRLGEAIPREEVEPVEAIFPRFMTAAMSLGALSPEAHEVLAVAMNRIGGRSNSGEGGEPAENFWRTLPGGGRANNRIKQVASARFGVTARYLAAAEEIQIKMAQGSKPGEGGQLPGQKVAAHIARVRHSPAGVTLISPPPHHDIYSMEDLAQLIYDLKRVNPAATVSVKLVSQAGIGTVAAGVAKAHADAIVVGGCDGGTGASPLGSIKNAGTPWELGLAEAQQVLVRGGLRGRVRLQVEGGLKTGRDVVLAALLGADEFGFGSAALVAAGCLMARQCHLNTCPAGIATQREDLRRKFAGTPEQVARFFTAVAEEVREILALLGFRRLQDVIGRTDLLEARPARAGKAATVSLSRLLSGPGPEAGAVRHEGTARNEPPPTGQHLDEVVLGRLRFRADGVRPVEIALPIGNADRAVGTRIAGELARRFRGRPVEPGVIRVRYRGAAGQSFGAFCVEGLHLRLEGEANDYLGKGMSGGEIALLPSQAFASRAEGQVIAGNTILYGATGGRAFIAGRVGERFAVRNSGALAVVEGVGDHACEYMTAGAVVVLGPFGRNFGAGMSGGLAYVFDPEERLSRRTNPEMVAV
ncbi:MAG: glutamate synthase large subunit, partial [Acidobacteria bacterium]